MMYEQFVARSESQNLIQRNPGIIRISQEDFYTGAGMVRAGTGPVFSVASYMGGIAVCYWANLLCAGRSFFYRDDRDIFMPSALLVLFFFPIWHNLKKYAIVYRALEGINSVVVGIMIAAALFMMKDLTMTNWRDFSLNTVVIAGTWALLRFTKLPSPVIVLICSSGKGLDLCEGGPHWRRKFGDSISVTE